MLSECSWSDSEPKRWRLRASDKQGSDGRMNERTNGRRLAFLELLSEPKIEITDVTGFEMTGMIKLWMVWYAVAHLIWRWCPTCSWRPGSGAAPRSSWSSSGPWPWSRWWWWWWHRAQVMSGSLPQSLLSTGTLSPSGQSTEAGHTRPHCTAVHSVHCVHRLSQDSFTLFQLKGSKDIIFNWKGKHEGHERIQSFNASV